MGNILSSCETRASGLCFRCLEHEAWLERERLAQEAFRKQREREEEAQREKEEREVYIEMPVSCYSLCL